MALTHNLGFPRIGASRELKFALESFWRGDISENDLQKTADEIVLSNYKMQAGLDFIPALDFSFYDHVLDMSAALGNLPKRANGDYFRAARGRANNNDCCATFASEMTKWFDTNYHYITPEFDSNTEFSLNSDKIINEFKKAKDRANLSDIKPVILGPLTYLFLGKFKDADNENNKIDKQADDLKKLYLLEPLLEVYAQLLEDLSNAGANWVQIDEPILAMDLSNHWHYGFNLAYHRLKSCKVNLAYYLFWAII